MSETVFPLNYVRMQCTIVANCFIKSAVEGYDSDDFAEQVMTSDYGVMVLTDHRMIEYSDSNFMFEGFTRELSLKKGKHYDTDILELAGYIYKYWVSTRQADPREVYKLAPIQLFANRYGFYHTQDFDYIINDIIDRPATETKLTP